MKKGTLCIYLVYILFFISGSLHGIGEKTVSLGGALTWNLAEFRNNITEIALIRPSPVLALSSAAAPDRINGSFINGNPDLSVSFDETAPGLFRDSLGHYSVIAAGELQAVDRRYSRAGTGAALFGNAAAVPNNGSLVIQPRSRNALFGPNSHIRDFTLEFWLYPLNMENGEHILSWVSAKPVRRIQAQLSQNTASGEHSYQRIQCEAVKNRLQWSFQDFFASVDNTSHINLVFSGNSPVVPKTWSHHLICFDANTGMLEYLVNGRSEAIAYATSSGREGGEVYTPITGENGSFVLGEHFMGLMDEFKIHSALASRSSIEKYAPRGGRTETRAIDLGEGSSSVLRIDAAGGRTRINGTRISNEFRENGNFRFSDDSQMQFFIRASNNPYSWGENAWHAFIPGTNLAAEIQGRYVQIAVDFYPSADGETSPYLDQLHITYMPGEPPLPPQALTATALDGGVLLRWRNSPDLNTTGYLIYYSSVRGEYFGEDAVLGPSPIDAGKRNSLFIEGLKNGTLYYFRISAYDRIDSAGPLAYHTGEFSKEVTARPLAGLSFQDLGP